jgi:DNA-binding MarR family transcriptional regulator
MDLLEECLRNTIILAVRQRRCKDLCDYQRAAPRSRKCLPQLPACRIPVSNAEGAGAKLMAGKRKAIARNGKSLPDDGGIRLDLQDRSFYRLSLLATQINRAIANSYVRNFGRPAQAWKVVTVLGAFGTLSASQINSHTSLEMDKVTRIVDRLVEGGLATRRQDSDDRRKVVIALSAKGKRVNSKIEQMIAEMEREFLIVLSRGERESLYALLDRLQVRADQVFTNSRQGKPATTQI